MYRNISPSWSSPSQTAATYVDLISICIRTPLILKHFFFLWAFLEWQVVTGMEAERITKKLAKLYMVFKIRKCCISHLLLIDKRTPVDLWRHKLKKFQFNALIFLQHLLLWSFGNIEPRKANYFWFVNVIKSIRARTFFRTHIRSAATWLKKFQFNALSFLQYLLLWSWQILQV